MPALNQPHFQDPDKAREYLERIQWPHGPVCPHCGSVSEAHYKLAGEAHRAGLWKCKDCREQFTVTVGTVFERSKIALNVWLQAVYLLCSSKKGMSAHQLHRTLGVTYKTAWFMAHRIREAFRDETPGIMGGNGGPVEVDETYVGKAKGARARRFRDGPKVQGTGGVHLRKVVSLVDRQGATRSFHIANIDAKNLKPILLKHIARGATVYTDNAGHYKHMGFDQYFAAHETTNHSAGEYARPGGIHSNTVEAYFGLLKRGLYGTYHHVSEAHLQRYLEEFDFRYTNRVAQGVNDTERAIRALAQIRGKRLTYRSTHGQQAQ